MNNLGSNAITALIVLIIFVLISATVASIITQKPGEISNQDMEKQLEEVLEEITTYIQIKDTIGRYYKTNGEQKIKRIALLIKPLISLDIDASELTIKICNGKSVKILSYSGNAEVIGSNTLFEHPIWNEISDNNFGFIVTHDSDSSLVEYDVINGDMAYTIIKLSEDFYMKKGETLEVTLFPLSGITTMTTLKAPLPIKNVVTFE